VVGDVVELEELELELELEDLIKTSRSMIILMS